MEGTPEKRRPKTHTDTGLPPVEVALSLTNSRSLRGFPFSCTASTSACTVSDLQRVTGLSLVDSHSIARLQFGNEFCERLQPTPSQLEQVLSFALRRGFAVTLASTILSDRGLARLRVLLSLLEPSTEVVANDWGTLRLLRDSFPKLVPIAGRLLCKMIKDPRLPSRQWAALYPHGVGSTAFQAMLDWFGIRRVELDVPPFAGPEDFRLPALNVSVHLPYGLAAKGRMCWFGSLRGAAEGRFTGPPLCRRECLRYVAQQTRAKASRVELKTVQRGNAVMYRHSEVMTQVLEGAFRSGLVNRAIVAGDWP